MADKTPTMEQVKARFQMALARKMASKKDRERRMDTRRKIILGGTLLERAEKDPALAALVLQLVEGVNRENDRAPFLGWVPPGSAHAPLPLDEPEDLPE